MGAFIDISGQKFGMLTVLHRAENRGRRTFWACRCDCGGYIETSGGDIKNGSVRSCGCIRRETARMNTFVDIAGQTFNRLTAIECTGSKDNRAMWLFRCSCGNHVVLPGKEVRTGNTQSCGCQKREHSSFQPGEKHPYYNSDLTDEEREKRCQVPEYLSWTKAVYKKYDYTCQKCNERGGVSIHAHHIESYASNRELRTDIQNGIVLCSTCHYAFHGKYSGITNREQLEEFLMNQNG